MSKAEAGRFSASPAVFSLIGASFLVFLLFLSRGLLSSSERARPILALLSQSYLSIFLPPLLPALLAWPTPGWVKNPSSRPGSCLQSFLSTQSGAKSMREGEWAMMVTGMSHSPLVKSKKCLFFLKISSMHFYPLHNIMSLAKHGNYKVNIVKSVSTIQLMWRTI